jgi:hypothetical protein
VAEVGEGAEREHQELTAIHVEEVPPSPASDTLSSPTRCPQQQLEGEQTLAAGDEKEEAVSVSSSTVKVSTCCKSDGDPSSTSETASGDWYVMPASPAASSPNRIKIGVSNKGNGGAEEEEGEGARESSPERPPSPTAEVTAQAKEGAGEALSEDVNDLQAAEDRKTGSAPAKVSDAALEDEDEDDLDEDWGAN